MKNVLAINVRRLRKQRKLSQNALAERAEISFRGLQDIEYEKNWPEWETVLSIARALGVSEIDLFQDPGLIPHPTPDQALTVLLDFVKKHSQ